MSSLDTIGRDNQSYRRGLILGLTLAEVMLLLIFALLIALSAVWKADKKKLMALEARIPNTVASSSPSPISKIVEMLSSADVAKAAEAERAVRQTLAGEKVRTLTENESKFLDAARRTFANEKPDAIKDDWTSLSTTVQNMHQSKWFAAPADRIAWDVDRALIPRPQQQGNNGHSWPPIIRLREAEGYFFKTGRSELPQQFQSKLDSLIVPQLLSIAKQYDVDVIEVIGHTDEQPISSRTSNLDREILPVLTGTADVSQLVPSDNAGLGLTRAVAVVRALSSDKRLQGYRILPLSAGELIDTDDTISQGGGGDVKERRRIEIRLRRSQS